MKKIYVLIISFSFLLGACNDLLEKVPSKQSDIVPTHVDYLIGLLSSDDMYVSASDDKVLLSDDFNALRIFQEQNDKTFSRMGMQFPLTWSFKNLTAVKYSRSCWESEYSIIYRANTILDYLSDVSGTEQEKLRLKADAHFIRAFSHFNLVNTFSLPYKADKSNGEDLGVPIQTFPSIANFPVRSSLEDTYQFIIDELKISEELLKDQELEIAPIGNICQWRASKPAVYALLSKVYFTIGDYSNAKDYATKAIVNSGAASLIDFNTEVSYADESVNKEVDVMIESGVIVKDTVKMPMTSNNTFEPFDWKENFYYKTDGFSSKPWLVPTDDLIQLYGETEDQRSYDLRWKYLFVQNFSYTESFFRGFLKGNTYNAPIKICAYKGLHHIGLNLADMYLVKAECEAREGNLGEAQDIINQFRLKRFDASAPSDIRNLTFVSKDDAIKKILDERRREMPFYSRWYDLRRIAANGEFSYIPEKLSRDFFEFDNNNVFTDRPKAYEFYPKTDYLKFAFPIPYTDIELAEKFGVILEQNKY
ncbi:RagB/SusD family nutrient uptake outer membrane protein [Ancylomarina euxinus]|uniref:RagB/SusD family nutrient uptake outer membrane protein n=1 Tax=Ancylomarina euxinus TaxID=2283627 RepID=A0A425XZ72_9BACT|nr:RagB/SusD family nutrient uptake outer membrane protein [Ancylomarina euxinus]MCZ4695583.1 RagB/SusD family nutrient uptake outer membrane protein [Ancylomarina euxinus]MUP15964.1 RagB/SusD family nutrient uptake outer membrane protein [Ancylomarina euxinus]RRG20406.1 RagB/SusD family nutrient uptake outer membrane protein [Ancylomarina euxinus]